MAAIVHGTSLAHPLESLQQAHWFRVMKAHLGQCAQDFWLACEAAGQSRAHNHLLQLAACHGGADPELARLLRTTIH